MARDTADIVAVEGLCTYFFNDQTFVRAVDEVSFQVPRSGRFGLAGESGSGKTQTALAIAGLVQGRPGVVAGRIRINGVDVLAALKKYCEVEQGASGLTVRKDLQKWRTHRDQQMAAFRGSVVSMVFQEPKRSLSPYFTVGAQASEIVDVHFGKEAAGNYQERVYPLLKKMEFRNPDRILSSYPHELSGGQSQRVMLALALLSEPALLIADEPTTLLDAVTERHVLDLLDAIVEERDIALLLITHDLGVMAEMVDRVAVMRHGRIVEQDATETLMNGSLDDRHPYTRQLRRAAERAGMLIAE